jgi:hypothetical protein
MTTSPMNVTCFKVGKIPVVHHLRSPPERPEYNGACEAGIGSMKTRTHHQAALRDCSGQWSSDDAEAARCQANETARPWGASEPTPDQCWEVFRVDIALVLSGDGCHGPALVAQRLAHFMRLNGFPCGTVELSKSNASAELTRPVYVTWTNKSNATY